MKQTFGSADIVGRCVVFDVGNNRFRLIARVFCESQKMYILKVMEFPLTSIRDDEHLAEARKVLNRLVMADLDKGSRDYLDALTDLVEKYEDEYVSIPDAPAQDVLRLLNGVEQAVAEQAGQEGRDSAIDDFGDTRRYQADERQPHGKAVRRFRR